MTGTATQTDLRFSSTELTWLGEDADSHRGVDLTLVRDAMGRLVLREPMKMQPGDIELPGITVRTEPESQFPSGIHRREVVKVTCTAADGGQFDLPTAEEFDAVFWSESAVRKFVWPYYHSHRLWDPDLQALKDEYDNDPEAMAIAHQAPSRSSTVGGKSELAGLHIGRCGADKTVASIEFVPAGQYLQERATVKARGRAP